MSGNRLEDVAVEVLVDSQWLDGLLDTSDKRGYRWAGVVRYQTAPAANSRSARRTRDLAPDLVEQPQRLNREVRQRGNVELSHPATAAP
jgi:hypothetical protein